MVACPEAINSSISRLDPNPACASSLCSFCVTAGAEAEAGSTPATAAPIFFFAGLSGLGAWDLDGLDDLGGFGNLAVILVSTFWFVVCHDLHGIHRRHLGKRCHSIILSLTITLIIADPR
jgi:hypothetical protein